MIVRMARAAKQPRLAHTEDHAGGMVLASELLGREAEHAPLPAHETGRSANSQDFHEPMSIEGHNHAYVANSSAT